ncbi:phenylacetate-coenzyme A ligase PaaK-like adenylate-forming protein [Crossiella equi]|uniref:long-chain-fatty-acyl-CoA reductase n=1 Tax=Crossiella equi TaxID=130796 RepID=A0ABS5A3Y5_9PSEU|nr:acyl-CoA reductase [Crossiella equi]MBP2471290.1 phenylacetate-coenzyme A ligase PaaK-like adenylate-forming protein [Crossiella equi]
MNQHYWQGEWVTDEEADRRLDSLEEITQEVLAGEPLSPLVVLAAADRLVRALAEPGSPVRARLAERLAAWNVPAKEIEDTLASVAGAMAKEPLERKVVRELGGIDPGRLARVDYRQQVFEAWVPVGLLAHIAPGNAPSAGAMSALEGLLSGNVNVVKTSGEDSRFTAELLDALAQADPTGQIARRVVVLHYSSSRKDWLARMCAPADAVAAWGGEEALAGVAEYVRPGCRLVDWGPKLSFAYLTADSWQDADVLAKVAADVCLIDQQACSSPQVVYLDTEDSSEVFAFAERFAGVLAEAVAGVETRTPSDPEWAEITNTEVVARLEEHLGLTKVFSAPDRSWRVMADTRSALRASPLYRSVWVKPLPRKRIAEMLRPMRRYLQTVGLGAARDEVAVLTRALLAAGVQRVTLPGGMLGSYDGEPHDGVYALQRYSRRVDVQLDERFATQACLDDMASSRYLPPPPVPVTTKAEFTSLQEDTSRAEVFFRSGGSTGAPKLSAFSWADYDEQMHWGAEGLLAAGLDPRTDRTMNLFFGGQLYGGFPSFFSVLERMRVVQYPMAAQLGMDQFVADTIVANGVNTVLGMPSYLLRLFDEAGDTLRAYRGIKKIFYGGEHFSDQQKRWLTEEFGVELIRSGAYGSVDGGPLGYACEHTEPRVHHLFAGLQTLEILAGDEDRPVGPGETGRLVFTSHTRRGQRLERYEIGDLGRWVEGDCPCGRKTPRFELLGRTGDVFRSAGHFLNYRRFVSETAEAFAYAGDLQIVLREDNDRQSVTVRLDRAKVSAPESAIAEQLLARYPDLALEVVRDGLVDLHIDLVAPDGFARATGSGKLIPVLDERARNN